MRYLAAALTPFSTSVSVAVSVMVTKKKLRFSLHLLVEYGGTEAKERGGRSGQNCARAMTTSAKRKRGSAPVSPPSDGRAARRARGSGGGASAAAAAEQEEPPTLVDVEGSWATFMQRQREAGQFLDVTLIAGGRRIEAHKNVIVGLSPYLEGLLTSGLAESAAQSQELTLEDMDGRAVEAVVDCMYSGKLALSPHHRATAAVPSMAAHGAFLLWQLTAERAAAVRAAAAAARRRDDLP